MRKPGQVALLRFPQVDLSAGKARPVLLIAQAPGRFEDWLVCMLSRQLHQAIAEFDEILDEKQPDFQDSGVKVTSVIRVGRLAVVSADILIGAIGQISHERLKRIKRTSAARIENSQISKEGSDL
jgi:mRNA interferase MazF